MWLHIHMWSQYIYYICDAISTLSKQYIPCNRNMIWSTTLYNVVSVYSISLSKKDRFLQTRLLHTLYIVIINKLNLNAFFIINYNLLKLNVTSFVQHYIHVIHTHNDHYTLYYQFKLTFEQRNTPTPVHIIGDIKSKTSHLII